MIPEAAARRLGSSGPAAESVGIGEGRVARGEGAILTVHGLGSCVAVCLYDPITRSGGLCHVVLPAMLLRRAGDPPSKFADTAVAWLREEMARQGAATSRLAAKIAGGASLFGAAPEAGVGAPAEAKLRWGAIGERNVAAVHAALAAAGIPLVAEHVGGTASRTVAFHLADGRVEVWVAGRAGAVL